MAMHARWYFVSSTFPLIAGFLGPIANLTNVASLAESWSILVRLSAEARAGLAEQDVVGRFADPAWVIALNALSLAAGLGANLALLLNFSGRVRYNAAQAAAILGFVVGAALLVVDVTLHADVTLPALVRAHAADGATVESSQGFWMAVMTCVLYGLCGALLAANEVGHLSGFYPAQFVLDGPQRSLMVQTLFFVTWLAIGAGAFARMEAYTFANGVYYCNVTILTIGLGDYSPSSDLPRALVLPYALVGILVLALIVSSIRTLVVSSGRRRMAVIRTDRLRAHALAAARADGRKTTDRDAFEAMRGFTRAGVHFQARVTLLFSTTVFLVVWLIGALVFCTIQNWSFFHALYFCSLCLLTIGYGDYVPTYPAAKAFFVIWSLIALPLVTILISNLSDTLIANVIRITNSFGDITLRNTMLGRRGRPRREQPLYVAVEGACRQLAEPFVNPHKPGTPEAESWACHRRRYELMIAMNEFIADMHRAASTSFSPSYDLSYTYEVWARLERHMGQGLRFDWLSESSPIRFHIRNEAIWFLKVYSTLFRNELDLAPDLALGDGPAHEYLHPRYDISAVDLTESLVRVHSQDDQSTPSEAENLRAIDEANALEDEDSASEEDE
ncbi:uncharacterized protein V1510DRAFT_392051 [Dipodascopsis tothii]|uniref:uncharacterized protein n=1 Tax=Dipodascopsis tothii TaxID=44089 RepID=UPI0034CF35A9